jgi:hypothetical protein
VDRRQRLPLHRICRNHCRVSATESYPLSEYESSRQGTFSWGTMVTRDRWTAGSAATQLRFGDRSSSPHANRIM